MQVGETSHRAANDSSSPLSIQDTCIYACSPTEMKVVTCVDDTRLIPHSPNSRLKRKLKNKNSHRLRPNADLPVLTLPTRRRAGSEATGFSARGDLFTALQLMRVWKLPLAPGAVWPACMHSSFQICTPLYQRPNNQALPPFQIRVCRKQSVEMPHTHFQY